MWGREVALATSHHTFRQRDKTPNSARIHRGAQLSACSLTSVSVHDEVKHHRPLTDPRSDEPNHAVLTETR